MSDNEAFNRLYEFLGQNYINDQLHKKGYIDAQVLHRLDVFLSEDENRHTNPVKFLDRDNHLLYSQPLVFNTVSYSERHDTLGEAYYSGGKLINTPMNFSKKNRISLEDLHQILRSVIFPVAYRKNKGSVLRIVIMLLCFNICRSFPGRPSILPMIQSIIRMLMESFALRCPERTTTQDYKNF